MSHGHKMHPLVRDLYRRLLWVGKDYPAGLAAVRERSKREIFANRALAAERDVLEAVHRGRWWVRELEGVVKLKKYRAMASRYGRGAAADETAAVARVDAALAAEAHGRAQKRAQ